MRILKTYIFGLLLLVTLFLFYLLNSQPVYAADPSVKLYIVAPKEYQTQEHKDKIENVYKPKILEFLPKLKAFYASQLEGHTFQHDSKIQVINVPKTAESTDKGSSTCDFLQSLLGESSYKKTFPLKDDSVYMLWVLGSGNLTLCAYSPETNGIIGAAMSAVVKIAAIHIPRIAMLNHDTLEDLSGPKNNIHAISSESEKRLIFVHAHELGHAFGLVNAGHARGHICSTTSASECLFNAPKPLPDFRENRDVMGFAQLGFDEMEFINTTHNPVKWKLYQSPFINPNKDPAPKPISLSVLKSGYEEGKKAHEITEKRLTVSYPPQIPPDSIFTLIIGEKSFGQQYNPAKRMGNRIEINSLAGGEDGVPLSGFEVISWQDRRIDIRIGKAPSIDQKTAWRFSIKDEVGNLLGQGIFFIDGEKQVTRLMTANFQTTCGNNHPLPGVKVNIVVRDVDRGDSILAQSISDESGQGSVSYSIYKPQKGATLSVTADALINAPLPTPNYETIEIDPNKDTSKDVTFNFARCPNEEPETSTQVVDREYCNRWDGQELKCNDASSGCVYFDNCNQTCWPADTRKEIACINSTANPESTFIPIPSPAPELSDEEYCQQFDGNIENSCISQSDRCTLSVCGENKCISKNSYDPCKVTQVATMLSNYDDFRETNSPDDVGSPTQGFANIEGIQQIEWTLSTLSQDNTLHIRKVFSDNTVEDYSINLAPRQQVDIGAIVVTAKKVKKIKNFTINDQEVSIEQLKWGYRPHLSFDTSQPQQISIPMVINFTDGSTSYLAWTFNYSPKITQTEEDLPQEITPVQPEDNQPEQPASLSEPDQVSCSEEARDLGGGVARNYRICSNDSEQETSEEYCIHGDSDPGCRLNWGAPVTTVPEPAPQQCTDEAIDQGEGVALYRRTCDGSVVEEYEYCIHGEGDPNCRLNY